MANPAIDSETLRAYLQRFGNIGPISRVNGLEGASDQWFAGGGQNATPYGNGTYMVYGQGDIDPNGTPGRGGIGGIYNAQGQLQGDPWYQQPTNIDWTGPAMVALAALGGAYGAGEFGGAAGADALALSEVGAGDVAVGNALGASGVNAGAAAAGGAAAGGGSGAATGGAAAGGSLAAKIAAATGISEAVLSTLAPAVLGTLAAATTDQNPTSTSSSTSDIPAWQRPYAEDLLKRGQTLANQPTPTYGGANHFALTSEQVRAMGGVQGAIDNFDTRTGRASNWMNSVLAGEQNFNPQNIAGIGSTYLGKTTPGASNPWIGAQSQGSAGTGSIASQIMPFAMQDNPFLGLTSGRADTSFAQQANRNPLLGLNNPTLNRAISTAQDDVIRKYSLGTAPQLDAQMHASGSYGNTGVQQMQQESQRQLAQELGRVDSDMRMADYSLQAGLGEGQAGREQGVNLANAGFGNSGSQFNASLYSGDLGRNVGAWGTGQGLKVGALGNAFSQDANNVLNNNQFNANLGYGDLTRNSNLSQNQGQFNSTLLSNELGRNAGLELDINRTNADIQGRNIGNAMTAWSGNSNLMGSMLNPMLAYANAPVSMYGNLFNMGTTASNTNAQGGMFDYNNWLYGNDWPMKTLQAYGNIFGNMKGGTTSSTQQVPGANPAGTFLGATLMGNTLFNGGGGGQSNTNGNSGGYMVPPANWNGQPYTMPSGSFNW